MATRWPLQCASIAGQDYNSNGHLHVDWVERIDIVHRMADLNRRLFRDMRAGIASRDFIVPGPIADHAPINYSILLSNALAG
jgi:hypothetical protein